VEVDSFLREEVVYHCGVEDHFVEVLFIGVGKEGDE
jgi:hypothetical protein